MRVVSPETLRDITLGQYQEFDLVDVKNTSEEDLKTHALRIFLNLSDNEIRRMSQNDKDDLVNDITKALNESPKFDVNKTPTFKIKGTRFGWHNNLNEMSSGEWSNLSTYISEVEFYHNLMAILFRPVTKKDMFGNYSIAAYNGTEEWGEVMKQTPMHIVQSSLFFFKSLARELLVCTQRCSTPQELVKGQKHQIFGLGGGGMQVTGS